ncbi:SapC family protein [Phenylobacterium aquaticum]|uniref:SapC family protein n=1 Tax=Phenylobacterium aquaticum TaxID=1763816 RepID=UPI0026EDA93D|nr:SapC family protein [Phenylobacterium aquaticum]
MADTKLTPGGEISGNVLFYSRPEPLSPDMHKGLGVKRMDGPFGFAKTGHAVPLAVTEFSLAAISSPIIFVGEDKLPLAVMGLNAEENLYLRDDGLFDAGVYVPAYIRRYPFVFANDAAAGQMILCIDRAAEFIVEGGDMAFFNADNTPTEYTQNCIEFCNNYEVERQRTTNFVQMLKDLDLFELKTATHTPATFDGQVGETQVIAEFFGVSEEKLNALPADKLIEMRDNGALMQIYAHLISLSGWDKLIALQVYKNFVATQAANA